MYVPYMYGRQYELLAIRQLLGHRDRDLAQLLPVVEPVMSRVNDLRRCILLCQDAGQALGVIVNPHRHQLRDEAMRTEWEQEVWASIDQSSFVVPTLRCDGETTRAQVEAFLARFANRELAISCFGEGMSERDMRWLAGRTAIRWFLMFTDHVSAQTLAMFPAQRTIWMKDCFNRLARNADYEGKEFFTERNRFYLGRAAGIGDYLCLGKTFQDGGGAPGAVAIHAVYKDQESQNIWIEHFVSDDQVQNQGDVAVKFLQAARKLAAAVRRRPHEFGTNPALSEYLLLVQEERFPQLATSKKLQMTHHMCLMMDVLQERI